MDAPSGRSLEEQCDYIVHSHGIWAKRTWAFGLHIGMFIMEFPLVGISNYTAGCMHSGRTDTQLDCVSRSLMGWSGGPVLCESLVFSVITLDCAQTATI